MTWRRPKSRPRCATAYPCKPEHWAVCAEAHMCHELNPNRADGAELRTRAHAAGQVSQVWFAGVCVWRRSMRRLPRPTMTWRSSCSSCRRSLLTRRLLWLPKRCAAHRSFNEFPFQPVVAAGLYMDKVSLASANHSVFTVSVMKCNQGFCLGCVCCVQAAFQDVTKKLQEQTEARVHDRKQVCAAESDCMVPSSSARWQQAVCQSIRSRLVPSINASTTDCQAPQQACAL